VAATDKMIDLAGVRIQLSTIDNILKLVDLMHTATLPPAGILIGMVVDSVGNPLPNMQVTADNMMSTVSYLSADRTKLVAGMTTASGIFLSTDAPYGTNFTAHGVSLAQIATGFGGLVHGKVTVVILHPQGT
jgi:hypothetical protein